MATKIISTYLAGSYDLTANYTALTITSAGGVGGNLTLEGNLVAVVNYGRVHGQFGLSSNYYIKLDNKPGAVIGGVKDGVDAEGLSIT
ncbi:MAG TPA: hypothetical protein VGH15_02775, partial [Caulobacteraceae bacterium]